MVQRVAFGGRIFPFCDRLFQRPPGDGIGDAIGVMVKRQRHGLGVGDLLQEKFEGLGRREAIMFQYAKVQSRNSWSMRMV